MKTIKRLSPSAFFYRFAGYGYDPAKETKRQGRLRGARHLAEAEKWAQAECVGFEWQIDTDSNSASFSKKRPTWSLWSCFMRGNGECRASLHAIDFGRDGEPWGQPYKRVVEAELALDAMNADYAHKP